VFSSSQILSTGHSITPKRSFTNNDRLKSQDTLSTSPFGTNLLVLAFDGLPFPLCKVIVNLATTDASLTVNAVFKNCKSLTDLSTGYRRSIHTSLLLYEHSLPFHSSAEGPVD
jgi:hypothetical protein